MEESKKPRVVRSQKLEEGRRLALGGLSLSVLTATAAAMSEKEDFNRVEIAVTVLVGLSLAYFRTFTALVVSGFGQVVFDGALYLKSHAETCSPWLGMDVSCSVAVFGIMMNVASPVVDQTFLTFWLIASLTVITLVNGTLFDMSTLDIDDDQLRTLMNNYKLKPKEFLREKGGITVRSTLYPASVEKKIAKLPDYTWCEIEKHTASNDIWVVVHDLVYDISSFYTKHPGGRKVLITMAGRDATQVLEEYHPDNVFNTIPKYLIGRLSTESDSASATSESTSENTSENEAEETSVIGSNAGIMKDFTIVRQIILELGLFETNLDYYYRKFLSYAIGLVGCFYLVFYSDSYIMHLASSICLAIVWQQAAFVAHDLGHTAMTHNRKIDFTVGAVIANLWGGISIGWWKLSHNVHHVNCNSVNDDPDIQHMPVFAVEKTMLNGFYSSFHDRYFLFDYASKVLLSFQHLLFYPVMAVARVNLYLQSILYFIGQPLKIDGVLNYDAEFKKIESVSLIGFFIWFSYLMSGLPTWNERICYIMLSHAVAGVLHVQICISHFTMKTYTGQFKNHLADQIAKTNKEDAETLDEHAENWLLLQLNTSMNVDTPVNMDFFHGGLQYQIEHHLFPRLPRHNLRIASRFIKEICKKHNIEYRNLTFWDANVEMYTHLKITAMAARNHKVGHRDFKHSEMYDAMNLIG